MPKSPAVPSRTPDPDQGAVPRRPAGKRADRLTRRIGLVRVEADALSIRRVRRGRGWSYLASDGTPVTDPEMLARFASRAAADSLANTPAICRKSYVHETVVTAFETGVLEGFSATMKQGCTAARREQIVAQVLARMAT